MKGAKRVSNIALGIWTALCMIALQPAIVSASHTGPIIGPLPYTVRSNPLTIAQYAVYLDHQFPTISEICFHFTFGFNPEAFENGEVLRVEVPGGTSGQLITNPPPQSGSSILLRQKACFTDPADTSYFLDGTHAIRIYPGNNNTAVTISNIGVSVAE